MKLLVSKNRHDRKRKEKEQNKNDEIPEQSTNTYEHDMISVDATALINTCSTKVLSQNKHCAVIMIALLALLVNTFKRDYTRFLVLNVPFCDFVHYIVNVVLNPIS